MIGLSNERRVKYRRLLLAKKLAQSNITEIRKGVEEKETEVEIRLTRSNVDRDRV